MNFIHLKSVKVDIIIFPFITQTSTTAVIDISPLKYELKARLTTVSYKGATIDCFQVATNVKNILAAN